MIFVGFFVALFLRLYGTTGVFLFIAGAASGRDFDLNGLMEEPKTWTVSRIWR
jgi:hypothetical protein